MKSWFCELEEELYTVINNSPLPIDGKYYILKSVFSSMETAYKEYLNMPEPQEQEIDEEEQTKEDFQIEKTVDKDGNFHIEATGADIGQVISEAFNQASEDIEVQEENSSSSND